MITPEFMLNVHVERWNGNSLTRTESHGITFQVQLLLNI